ncbi:MAG TPA: cation diffusion facilitator family transporter [Chitinophagaceae bacterium]|nr:cation diffusion facilitator family transporter [Chitinophagaceae bacterium]
MNQTIRIQRLIAIFSVVLFVGKLWAWYLTHSVAILTDALESTVNVITGFIGLFSVSLAARPRDMNHPYGHGKAEFVSAAVEGALILIAGLMIIYQVIYVYFHPVPLHSLDTGMLLTGITGVLNFGFGVFALRIARRNHSIAVEAAATHLKSDAYSTFAIVAGLLIVRLTGLQWIDQLLALVFGVVIIVTGYRVLRKSLSGIMDEADEALLNEVLDTLNQERRPSWLDLHNLRAIQYGDVLHIDAHLTLPWYFTVEAAGAETRAMEASVSRKFKRKVECFIHVDASDRQNCSVCGAATCTDTMHLSATPSWTLEHIMTDRVHELPAE